MLCGQETRGRARGVVGQNVGFEQQMQRGGRDDGSVLVGVARSGDIGCVADEMKIDGDFPALGQ